jgi:hypothetical protein
MFQVVSLKVHSWYPLSCCSDNDCHPVPCDQLLEGVNGTFVWESMIFAKDRVYSSMDQFCHVCHIGTAPICAFIQNSF